MQSGYEPTLPLAGLARKQVHRQSFAGYQQKCYKGISEKQQQGFYNWLNILRKKVITASLLSHWNIYSIFCLPPKILWFTYWIPQPHLSVAIASINAGGQDQWGEARPAFTGRLSGQSPAASVADPPLTAEQSVPRASGHSQRRRKMLSHALKWRRRRWSPLEASAWPEWWLVIYQTPTKIIKQSNYRSCFCVDT